jgi:hypothetical protein
MISNSTPTGPRGNIVVAEMAIRKPSRMLLPLQTARNASA